MGCAPSRDDPQARELIAAWNRHQASTKEPLQAFMKRHQVRVFLRDTLRPPLGFAGLPNSRRSLLSRLIDIKEQASWEVFEVDHRGVYLSQAQLLDVLRNPGDSKRLEMEACACIIEAAWRGRQVWVRSKAMREERQCRKLFKEHLMSGLKSVDEHLRKNYQPTGEAITKIQRIKDRFQKRAAETVQPKRVTRQQRKANRSTGSSRQSSRAHSRQGSISQSHEELSVGTSQLLLEDCTSVPMTEELNESHDTEEASNDEEITNHGSDASVSSTPVIGETEVPEQTLGKLWAEAAETVTEMPDSAEKATLMRELGIADGESGGNAAELDHLSSKCSEFINEGANRVEADCEDSDTAATPQPTNVVQPTLIQQIVHLEVQVLTKTGSGPLPPRVSVLEEQLLDETSKLLWEERGLAERVSNLMAMM